MFGCSRTEVRKWCHNIPLGSGGGCEPIRQRQGVEHAGILSYLVSKTIFPYLVSISPFVCITKYRESLTSRILSAVQLFAVFEI